MESSHHFSRIIPKDSKFYIPPALSIRSEHLMDSCKTMEEGYILFPYSNFKLFFLHCLQLTTSASKNKSYSLHILHSWGIPYRYVGFTGECPDTKPKILLALYQTLPSDEDCSIDTHVSFNTIIFLIITSVKVDTTSDTVIKNILSQMLKWEFKMGIL